MNALIHPQILPSPPTTAPQASSSPESVGTAPSSGPEEQFELSPKRSRLLELSSGAWAALPLALSLLPFMGVFGVVARAAGLSLLEAQAMAVLVFSGAQLPVVQLLPAGVPGVLLVAASATMNARYLLYSAQLAPFLRRLPLAWRLLLAYLLTDEVWMLSLQRFRQHRDTQIQHWFALGAGLTIWLAMQMATLLGGLFGAQIPPSWHLEVAAPLALLSLLILILNSWAEVAAALAAGGAVLLLAGLPLNLGLAVATGVGVSIAQVVERVSRPHRENPS